MNRRKQCILQLVNVSKQIHDIMRQQMDKYHEMNPHVEDNKSVFAQSYGYVQENKQYTVFSLSQCCQ